MDDHDEFSTQIVLSDEDEERESNHRASKKRRKNEIAIRQDALNWGSDPLFWTHLCLLNIHVTKGLIPSGDTWETVNQERQSLGFNHALPKSMRIVSCCHVMGVLVRLHKSSIFTTYTIDDGTDLLDCVEWTNDQEYDHCAKKDYVLGAVLRCFGKFDWPQTKFQSSFRRSVRRVLLTKPPIVVRNIEEELFHWKTAIDMWNGLYTQPFNHPTSIGVNKLDELNEQTVVDRPLFHFGGQVEDALMSVINTTAKMPLLTPKTEPYVRERFLPFFKICFERTCLSKEEPLASLVTLKSGGDRHSMELIVNKALRRLCFRGHILVMDSKLELYAILTHEGFLAPAILRVLAKHNEKFMEHKTLLRKLKGDPRLCKVSEDRVNASLRRLVAESHVFEGDVGTFALHVLKE